MTTLCRKGRPFDKGLPFFCHLQSIKIISIIIILCLLPSNIQAKSLTVERNSNTASDFTCNKAYYGASNGYSNAADVSNFSGCLLTTFCIEATAYDFQGQEGGYFNKVSDIGPGTAQEFLTGSMTNSEEALGNGGTDRWQPQSLTAVSSPIDFISVVLAQFMSPDQIISINIRPTLSKAPPASAQILPFQVTSMDKTYSNNSSWVSTGFSIPTQIIHEMAYYLTLDVTW